jgi:hypothetical protein
MDAPTDGRRTLGAPQQNDLALLVAMPLRHLEAAHAVCEERGTVTLPAGGSGDLDACEPGLTVLLIATDADEAQVPAATWRAAFDRRVGHEPGTPWPDGLPSTWTDEHAPTARAEPPPPVGEDDPDDEDDDDERVGPQSFFRVRDLVPSVRSEWVHANELVPKQHRRGRSFVPRTPRIVRFVD